MKVPSAPQEKVALSESVIKFIWEHIHSVKQLEVLLLLHSSADQEWTAEGVNLLLRSSISSVIERLDDLTSRNLLIMRMDDTQEFYRFSDDVMLIESVSELKESYKVFTVRMIETIYARPSISLQDFSNSFRIKKK